MTAYGMDEKEVMRAWWTALSKMDKFFKKNLKIEEANHISEVSKKGIEPAYNFYKIEPQRVIDRAGSDDLFVGLLCLLYHVVGLCHILSF